MTVVPACGMPMSSMMRAGERHYHYMASSRPDFLVASRTDISLFGSKRLHLSLFR